MFNILSSIVFVFLDIYLKYKMFYFCNQICQCFVVAVVASKHRKLSPLWRANKYLILPSVILNSLIHLDCI